MQSHLFIVGANALGYRHTVQRIRGATITGDSQEAARLELEEATIAEYIFTTYEQLYFNWQDAHRLGQDPGREEFLRRGLEGYYADLLCNRRLLWYWNKHGGGLEQNYSPELAQEYKQHVLNTCSQQPDEDGPFSHKPLDGDRRE
jgi:hypothetical protein